MRIVVSGTHASGKTTLVEAFASAHPEYTVLPDPYELLDGADDYLDAGLFFTQLRLAAARLDDADADAIAERGPLDFLAYLVALETLGRPTASSGLIDAGTELVMKAMAGVDLLVVLPLSARDDVAVGLDEDLELREAMNDALLELIDDPELTGDARVVEIGGSPARRLAQLEAAVDGAA